MSVRCFYHSADLDGHCSGAIIKHKHPEAIMYPINYGDEFPWDEIEPDDIVYMVDFCLQPEDQMYNLADKLWRDHDPHFIWIDHHKSAIDACVSNGTTGIAYGKRDISKAACELTWEYLFPDKPMPLAVELLGLYDSWRYHGHPKESMVLPFQMRMRMEDLDPKGWLENGWYWKLFFVSDENATIQSIIEEGKLLLRYDEEQKRRYIATYGFETELFAAHPGPIWPAGKYKAITVNLGHTNSKVFDSVWDESKYDLMITFCRRKDKLWNVSLYSTKGDIDCGAIAKSFGGGGHKGAAGFQAKELPFEY